MKKNILSAILMLFALSAMAETEIDDAYRWYLQAHINAGYNANEDMRYGSFGKGIGIGGDLSLGYNFNDFWGAYLELGYYGNKGAYLNDHNGKDYKVADFGHYKYSSIEPTINVSYNLTNGLLGYKPYRRNAFYAHLGVGAAFNFSNNAPSQNKVGQPTGIDASNATTPKCAVGFNYVYMFNNTLAFTADATAHIIGDKANGADWQVPVDGRFNIGVGLRVYLGKSKMPSRVIEYVDQINTVVDTITVVEKVNVDVQDVYPIRFAAESKSIDNTQNSVIANVAQSLMKQPGKIVYVLGYADNTEGKDAAELAKSRADAVTAELVKAGIDPERIVTHDVNNAPTFQNLTARNRTTLCIITDLKH